MTNNVISFFKKNIKNEENFDELILDFYKREYELNGNIDKRELSHKINTKIQAHRVDDNTFHHVLNCIIDLWQGEEEYCETSFDCRQEQMEQRKEEQVKKPVVSKEIVWKILKLQASPEETAEYYKDRYNYEKDCYFNADVFVNAIKKYRDGELSAKTISRWCRCAMHALDSTTTEEDKIRDIEYELSETFDFFITMCDMKNVEISNETNKLIAQIKYYNHQIECLKNDKQLPFSKNGIVVYINENSWCENGDVVRFCVINTDKEEYNVYYELNHNYDEELNYNFVTDVEFEYLPTENKFNRELKAEEQKKGG